MLIAEVVESLLHIIYPEFYVQTDIEQNELVFLKTGEEDDAAEVLQINDKTACEAVMNHVHLFDHVSTDNYTAIKNVGNAIAKNLFDTLVSRFPHKHFRVYFTLQKNDAAIIRFHQTWSGEPPYYQANGNYSDTEIICLHN